MKSTDTKAAKKNRTHRKTRKRKTEKAIKKGERIQQPESTARRKRCSRPKQLQRQKEKQRKIPVPSSPFLLYAQALQEEEQYALVQFFEDMHCHVLMAKGETRRIRMDFENALLYYAAAGVPLEQALGRLAVTNLGGFYARPPIRWYALDDAAKIYPLSMRHGQMSVFRLSVTFKQAVVPELLQMALTFTIKRFPSFATTVKKAFSGIILMLPSTGTPLSPKRISPAGPCRYRAVARNPSV